MYIRCLDIWYDKLRAVQLRPVFNALGNKSHLHTLELSRLRRGGRAKVQDSVARFTSFERYPEQTQHPLGLLKNLRCLKLSTDTEAEEFEQRIDAVLRHIGSVAEAEGTQVVVSRWFDKRPTYHVGDVVMCGRAEELGGYCYRVHDGKPMI